MINICQSTSAIFLRNHSNYYNHHVSWLMLTALATNINWTQSPAIKEIYGISILLHGYFIDLVIFSWIVYRQQIILVYKLGPVWYFGRFLLVIFSFLLSIQYCLVSCTLLCNQLAWILVLFVTCFATSKVKKMIASSIACSCNYKSFHPQFFKSCVQCCS